MEFSKAMDMMKMGKKIQRKGWGSSWLEIEDGQVFKRSTFRNSRQEKKISSIPASIHGPDLLATDWEIFDEMKNIRETMAPIMKFLAEREVETAVIRIRRILPCRDKEYQYSYQVEIE